MILDTLAHPILPSPPPAATPRYLFRVWSPNSDGENSVAGFKSLGHVKKPDGPRELSSLDATKAKQMIMHHVQWTSKTQCHSDVLISFTSSLLFAIQHTIRKINTTFPSNPDTPQNCYLTIVDTSQVDQKFYKTTSLIDHYNIIDTDWQVCFKRPQHEHEYLTEWTMDLRTVPSCSSTVNFGLLMSKGIDQVVPQLDMKYQKTLGLHESLQGFLSHVRAHRYTVPKTMSFEEMTAVSKLAASFRGKWRQVMHIWFMALSKRKLDDQAILDTLKRTWNTDGKTATHDTAEIANCWQKTYSQVTIRNSSQGLRRLLRSESSLS